MIYKIMVCNFRADNLRKPGKAKKANEFSDANQILKKPVTNWIRAYSLDPGGACHPSDERNNEKESLKRQQSL